jgi:hypothetical protein
MVQFFRSGQHDDRRRRVVAEDATGTVAVSSKPAAPRRAGSRRYAVEALRERQPPLMDFVPQTLTKLSILLFVGLATIAGLEAVYVTRALDIGDARLPAFDLALEGSLNNWFTSITLDLAGVVAIVIYSLRRHRLDDYHGRYRIWMWAAACWLWLSIDEAASLHESIQTALAEFAGETMPDTELVWVGFYALVVGGIAARLIFEMRSCVSSTCALVLSGVVFTAAVAAHFGWLPPAVSEYRVLVEEGCEMTGSLLLLFSMCLHARYVILDSQGLLAARPEKASAPRGRRSLWGGKAAVDPAHDSVRPAGRRSDLEPIAAKGVDDDEDEDAADDDDADDAQSSNAHNVHRLSKAERKALRRQQERQRKAKLG